MGFRLDELASRAARVGRVWLGLMGVWAMACTEPQSGVVVKTWCPPLGATAWVVDDMEDADAVLCKQTGSWAFAASDGTAVTAPAGGAMAVVSAIDRQDLPQDRQHSSRAIHLAVGGLTPKDQWIQLAGTFNGPRSVADYSTIQFWMKSAQGGLVRVSLATGATLEAPANNQCDAATGPCPDHFGREIDTRSPLPIWTKQEIPLNGLAQQHPPTPPLALDPMDVRSIIFRVESADGFSNPDTVDLWIDDLQFVP